MGVEIKESLWRRGKSETKKFYRIKLSKKTNFITFFFGIDIRRNHSFPICLFNV